MRLSSRASYGVAHLDHLGGVLDAAPGQLGDVDHAVHAASLSIRALLEPSYEEESEEAPEEE